MEKRRYYDKKLCMTELEVEHSCFDGTHYFNLTSGNVNSSFYYIVKGRAVLNTIGERFVFETGSLFYVPEGLHYNSVWEGSAEIEYYAFHIVSHKINLSDTEVYGVQRLDTLSTPETGETVRRIFDLFATGDRVNKVRAIGIYYGFYADVLPCLHAEKPVEHSPVLLSAVSYIDRHFATDFDIEELAEAVFISSSRLYHLFGKELHTTPVRYRNEVRIEAAARALRTGENTVEEIAAANGFHSVIYFRRAFKDYTGLTPTEYRRLSH